MKNKDSHIAQFKDAISEAANESPDQFFTWFNQAADLQASFLRANWDFGHHIARPLTPLLRKPEELTALEIGYGGGRLLSVAARHFSKVIGVDVHPQSEKVFEMLASRGIQNAELHTASGNSLPVPNDSVDVVYSFIVLQHVEKIEIFNAYLEETFRILKPGGLALLYFGRWSGSNQRSQIAYWLDSLLENIKLPKGYLEIEAEVNHTNLLVTKRYVKAKTKQLGFEFLKFCFSYKNIPDGYGRIGGQHGILLRKPL